MAANNTSETDELSAADTVAFFGLLPLFVIRLLAAFAVHKNPALHWRQRLALTFLQAQRTTFSNRHQRWLVRRVSTGEAITQHCRKNKIAHKTVLVKDSKPTPAAADLRIPPPILHFLTPPAASQDGNGTGPTLVYFHGGGFVNPLRGEAHMPFIMKCAASCRASQVVILEYALAPEHPYPTQLVQCVATVRHLLEKSCLLPSDLILAGDSAGGQLVGAVLAHLVHPSPYAPPLKVDGQFRAALLVSPFVRLAVGADFGTYQTNDGRDYLNRPQVDAFGDAWQGRGDEIWANLGGTEAAAEVWPKVFDDGPRGLVRKALITVGTAEIFLGCCRDFARDYAGAETVAGSQGTDWRALLEGKERVLAECDGEAHVQVALDSAVGYDKGAMGCAIMSWLALV
ncbi:Alpha/Beta hydrolase protein [Staphylotrichum tortipilum]|uniref:Alpha/Beta hydrolase protein n=1 Tax=Staphylotrichum tortipilum TaxID=2831512 RepID=A0AAN6RTC7_9PEZI|nr:Alpha/Beta hydrolase protein [Staphylotrichum longicolle]